MGFLAWIILGLIVGAIVKAVMPGRVGGGWVTSLILGVVGAIVGGFYASGMSLDEIDRLFRNKTLMHAYDTVPIPVRVALIPLLYSYPGHSMTKRRALAHFPHFSAIN